MRLTQYCKIYEGVNPIYFHVQNMCRTNRKEFGRNRLSFRYKERVNRYADMWRVERHSAFEEAAYWLELLIQAPQMRHMAGICVTHAKYAS